jgi:hypothetical protein
MSNLLNGLAFSLSCLTDLADQKIAQEVINVFLASASGVKPRKAGAFQADSDIRDAQALVRLLVNEDSLHEGMQGGSLVLEVSKDCGFQVQWNKSPHAGFPFVGGHLMFPAISKNSGLLDDFLALIKELVRVTSPAYGEVRSMAVRGWDAPMNLELRLPDVPSVSIYGREYIDMFGREKIDTAPFVAREIVGECYWLVAHQPVIEGVPDEQRQRIRNHLGADAFMADGKWKYSDGRAPNFNLSALRGLH